MRVGREEEGACGIAKLLHDEALRERRNLPIEAHKEVGVVGATLLSSSMIMRQLFKVPQRVLGSHPALHLLARKCHR